MDDSFFENLNSKLKESGKWPQVYLFKFIIPSDSKKLALVQALFGEQAQVTTRQSKNNKYISISAKEVMVSSEKVIDVYRKASEIEGIISL